MAMVKPVWHMGWASMKGATPAGAENLGSRSISLPRVALGPDSTLGESSPTTEAPILTGTDSCGAALTFSHISARRRRVMILRRNTCPPAGLAFLETSWFAGHQLRI